jgi:hypothetical protein
MYDLIPFEIFYEICGFLPTCKDRLNFQKTCRLFHQGFPKQTCKINQKEVPLRKLWKDHVFGPRIFTFPLSTHKCSKPKINFDSSLNLQTPRIYSVLGTSKKLFRYVLNLISQRNHVGGAVVNTHYRLSSVASSYAPKQCFIQNSQFDSYEETVENFIKNARKIDNYQQHCQSFLIYFNQTKHCHQNYSLIRTTRHILIDLLYQEDNPLNLDPVIRSSLDLIFLKKQQRSNMTQIKKFFIRMGFDVNQAINLFNKTLKTNLIVLMFFERENGWVIRNVNITDCLVPNFLSDYFFWNHMSL